VLQCVFATTSVGDGDLPTCSVRVANHVSEHLRFDQATVVIVRVKHTPEVLAAVVDSLAIVTPSQCHDGIGALRARDAAKLMLSVKLLLLRPLLDAAAFSTTAQGMLYSSRTQGRRGLA
jgi:hypothetical protein